MRDRDSLLMAAFFAFVLVAVFIILHWPQP